jgi:uncharacterized membrane protein
MSGSGTGGDDDPPKLGLPALRQEIEGVLEEAEVPADKRELVVERFEQIVLQAESYEGDLPHPRHVAQFEQTLQGAAERIFAMTEKQLDHRIASEREIISATTRYGTRGQYIGATLIILPLLAAFYCAVTGHSWEITGLFLAPPVITGAVAFVNHQVRLYRENDDEDE